MAIQRPVRLWRAQPGGGADLSLAIAADSQGWLQVIGGSGQADGHPLRQGDGLGFPAAALDSFVAGPDGADLLLFELR